MNTPKLVVVVGCLLAQAACSALSFDGSANDSDARGPGDGEEPAFDSDTGAPVATTWGLGGDLVLAEGGLVPEASSLQLQSRGVVCDVGVTVTRVELLIPQAAEADALFHLWRLTAAPDPDATCTWRGPTTFELGLGPSDPALRPAADRAGLDAASAYSLVLGTGGRRYAVGLAGTEAVLEGEQAPATAAPLPDGEYRLYTLLGQSL